MSYLTTVLALVGEIVPIDKAAETGKELGQAGHVTLTWMIGILLLLGLIAVGFKKSKRTHLD